jgi:hypothetical protein
VIIAIASKTVFSPATAASAQGQFAGVEFSAVRSGFEAIDTRTGEFWEYGQPIGVSGKLMLRQTGRISKLGQPEIPLSVDK